MKSNPRKRNIIFTIMLFLLVGCAKSEKHYAITVISGEKCFQSVPKQAVPGEKVEIRLYSVTDVIPKVSINGEDICSWDGETLCTFVMPEQEVSIACRLKNAWEESYTE